MKILAESAHISTPKRRSTLAPALQAAPSPLASFDSQIVRRQGVSPATMAWDFIPPDLAPIDIGEVDDRRTISRDQAPATTSKSIAYKVRPATMGAGRALFRVTAPLVACLFD
jgi:hypothetical protein